MEIPRPPLWGPPNCEVSCVIPFPVYHVSCALSVPVSVSGSRIGFSDPGTVVTRAQEPNYLAPAQTVLKIWGDPRITLKGIKFQASLHGNRSHENSSRNHGTWTLEAIPNSTEMIFCNTLHARHRHSNPEIIRKANLGTNITKYTFSGPRYPRNFQNGVPKSDQNQ